jgi:hypothetical protein
MKKIKLSQNQNRLKLGRETLRVLTPDELQHVAGGHDPPSPRCSDYGICFGGQTGGVQ